MLYIYPDYFPSFRCLARACRHTCCAGWEIYIDRETVNDYAMVEGDFGIELKNNIREKDGEFLFCLDENERCKFLNKQGLCRIIQTLGEDWLCEICAEHPRFYNYYSDDFAEIGLGACCELAAHLLITGEVPIRYLSSGDFSDEVFPDDLKGLVELRGDILSVLYDTNKHFSDKITEIEKLMSFVPNIETDYDWIMFFRELEIMNPEWLNILNSDSLKNNYFQLDSIPDNIITMRVIDYFLYRYFLVRHETPTVILEFALLSVWIIYKAAGIIGLEEAVRLYSAEIEYSDDNMTKVMGELNRVWNLSE